MIRSSAYAIECVWFPGAFREKALSMSEVKILNSIGELTVPC